LGDVLTATGALHWSAIALGFGVCFLAGVVGGLSGFGTGILVALFMAPLVGAKALIPLMAIVMLINNSSRVWFFRQGLDLKVALGVLTTAIPAAYLGVEIYARLEASFLQVLIGLVISISVPLKYWIKSRPAATGLVTVSLFGMAYGLLSSVVVGAGMIIMPALLGMGLVGPALIATDAMIAVGINVAKAIFLQKLDVLTPSLALYGLGAGLATIPGVALASKISERLGVKLHTRIVEALVVVGGLHMTVKGLVP
jgi:uncharacterized membrane protein YfcA